MTDLDAIRARHRPKDIATATAVDNVGIVETIYTVCEFDKQDWGEAGCDTAQALARVADLERTIEAMSGDAADLTDALTRVAELETVLRETLATIERLYHPEIGWYVHPVYIRAARLVDAALARPESEEAE